MTHSRPPATKMVGWFHLSSRASRPPGRCLACFIAQPVDSFSSSLLLLLFFGYRKKKKRRREGNKLSFLLLYDFFFMPYRLSFRTLNDSLLPFFRIRSHICFFLFQYGLLCPCLRDWPHRLREGMEQDKKNGRDAVMRWKKKSGDAFNAPSCLMGRGQKRKKTFIPKFKLYQVKKNN